MARKAKKCPHFTSRKRGKWTEMVCALPDGMVCPNPHCKANPDEQEPVEDAGD
ncbi:hypothetical protein ASZ90_015642 [hydrocarbon metagenome]|jgi:hypothetical protein|uniref:Uncharacterized protein n=1 Tax=hydrocarbon metagenome TaxID=938273 RepID=A0A0W8F1G8_9ZZZZ